MRVLVAPDSFTDALTSAQAAGAIAAGWARAAPHDEVVRVPLSDGGPGFLDALAAGLGGQRREVGIEDALGRPVTASILVVGAGTRRTAYLESSQACGLHLLAAEERDPGRASTYGVGQLLAAALGQGAKRVVVGLGARAGGASAANDAGAGMMAALGAGPPESLARGGLALAGVVAQDLTGLARVRERLSGVELLIASDSQTPLLGMHGASATSSPGAGARPETAQALESALGNFVDTARRAGLAGHVTGGDLLTGRPLRLDREPGAGAAGGLGYGLLLLGGRRVSAVAAVLEAAGLAGLLAQADLVATGERCFDWQSLRGTVVSGVAEAGLAAAVPVVVIAASATVGRREAMSLGVSGVYAVATGDAAARAGDANLAEALADCATRVARTWSPGGPEDVS